MLREVARVGYGADDSEPGRAVRVRDDPLVRAFRRPGGAPYLQEEQSNTGHSQRHTSPDPLLIIWDTLGPSASFLVVSPPFILTSLHYSWLILHILDLNLNMCNIFISLDQCIRSTDLS